MQNRSSKNIRSCWPASSCSGVGPEFSSCCNSAKARFRIPAAWNMLQSLQHAWLHALCLYTLRLGIQGCPHNHKREKSFQIRTTLQHEPTLQASTCRPWNEGLLYLFMPHALAALSLRAHKHKHEQRCRAGPLVHEPTLQALRTMPSLEAPDDWDFSLGSHPSQAASTDRRHIENTWYSVQP